MSRAIAFEIGSDAVEGRLPLLPARYALAQYGFAVAGQQYGVLMAAAGAIGLCHPEPSWRPLFKVGDVGEFAEEVADALMEKGLTMGQIIDSGADVYMTIVKSLPREEDVQAATDPTSDPAETSTDSSSGSDSTT